jgi:hypothetical protein
MEKEQLDKEHLLTLVQSMETELRKKQNKLREMRLKLRSTQLKVAKLKSVVEYQRGVILELRRSATLTETS